MTEQRREIHGKYICVSAKLKSYGYPEDDGYTYFPVTEAKFGFVPFDERDKTALNVGAEYAEKISLDAPPDTYQLCGVYDLWVVETTRTRTYTDIKYEAKK